jgi:hypothetical protein
MKINLIARTNGVGLDADVALVNSVLEAEGHSLKISHSRAKSWIAARFAKPQYDVNIFMERIFPNWLGFAQKNILIPNQERFPRRHLKRLKRIDEVWCKSRHAESIFKEYTKTQYIGFTSKDLLCSETSRDYQAFFHLAGRSTLKGTETLLEIWTKHPDWPTLNLVQHAQNAPTSVPANVSLMTNYLTADELTKLMNQSGVHLCPSRSEGWGHYIVEAMSCEALVLTTDAPPMNELIQAERGMLIPPRKSEPRHLGTNFFVCRQRLESHIQQVLKMPIEEKRLFGRAARKWYESNHSDFKSRLLTAINSLALE